MKTQSLEAISGFLKILELNKGLRATLRRADEPNQAQGFEAVIRFAEKIKPEISQIIKNESSSDADEIAEALAILLAHKKISTESSGNGLAAKLGEKKNSGPRLSQLRFAKLIHARNVQDRFRLLRRALPLLGNEIAAIKLAEGWLQLNHAKGRRDLARAYFTTHDLLPETVTNRTATEATP